MPDDETQEAIQNATIGFLTCVDFEDAVAGRNDACSHYWSGEDAFMRSPPWNLQGDGTQILGGQH